MCLLEVTGFSHRTPSESLPFVHIFTVEKKVSQEIYLFLYLHNIDSVLSLGNVYNHSAQCLFSSFPSSI
jgi:hypothetical protein